MKLTKLLFHRNVLKQDFDVLFLTLKIQQINHLSKRFGNITIKIGLLDFVQQNP